MRTPISATDRRGFTLLELMLVVTIVGVVSAIAFVRLDNMVPAQRLRAAAAMIVGAAENARAEARLKQVTVSLTYDMDKSTLSLAEPAPEPPAAASVDEVDASGKVMKPVPEETAAVAPAAYYDKDAPLPGEPVLMSCESLPDGVSIETVYYSETGMARTGVTTADFRPSGAVGEHMVVLKEKSGGTVSVFVPALSGTAFIVDPGETYGQIRARRRLK